MTLWHDIKEILEGNNVFYSADEIIQKLEKAGRQSRSEIIRQKLKKFSQNGGDVIKITCITKRGRIFGYMWRADFERIYK